MTKLEVSTLLRQRTGLTQKQALKLLDLFLECVKTALLNGKKVSLVGFGTFSVKTRPARLGRNPRTSEAIRIPEKTVVTFKPGRKFCELVDGTRESATTNSEESALAAVSAQSPQPRQ
jgi:nucleoid DNA-binding protein